MILDKQLVTKILDAAEPRHIMTEDEWQQQIKRDRIKGLALLAIAITVLAGSVALTGYALYLMWVH